MQTFEVLIWSVTAGGILVMASIALAVALMHWSRAALQTFGFLASSGASVLLMSGLVVRLWPTVPPHGLLAAQVGVVPLSCAIALSGLGGWLGAGSRDRMVFLAVRVGRFAMVLTGLGLMLAVLVMRQPNQGVVLLQTAAVANFLGVVLAALAAVRTALLGDRLSWFMVVACACLAAGAASLHVHAIEPAGLGLAGQAVSALLLLAYFVIVGWLAFSRDMAFRRIQRRLGADAGRDPLTKLAQGTALFGHIERAARRSARLHRPCAVIAISVKNLYALNDELGHDVDHDVAVVLAARIRSLAGIHNSVGLYHPSCFVVVVAAVQFPAMLRTLGLRLASGLRKPLLLGQSAGQAQSFQPDVGVGIALLDGDLEDASYALEEAEYLAVHSRGFVSRTAIRSYGDESVLPVDEYDFTPRRRRRAKGFEAVSSTRY